MSNFANHSIALMFLAILLFLFLFAGAALLWYAARMNLNEEHSLLRSSLRLLSNEDGSINYSCRREFSRIAIEGLQAEISDGLSTYSGLVTNISAHGLCLRDVPEKLPSSRSLLSVVVRGQAKNYRLVTRPCWTRVQDNNNKTLGVEIASSPTKWNEFVFSH